MRLRHAPRPKSGTSIPSVQAPLEPRLQFHFRRIDDGHAPLANHVPAALRVTTDVESDDSATSAKAEKAPEFATELNVSGVSEAEAWRQSLLRLHAEDLVVRLQDWADDVDAREALLNARVAMHERSERTFRMKQQAFQTEMAERQNQVERLKERVEMHAHRIAFRDHDSR